PEARHPVHESPRSMTVPLVILAVLSVVGGWVGIPLLRGMDRIGDFLAPSLAPGPGSPLAGTLASAAPAAEAASPGLEIGLMLVSVAAGVAGIALAWLFYVRRPELPERLASRLRGAYRTLLHKYWVDEAYGAAIVRPAERGSVLLWQVADNRLVDGLV